MGHPALIGIFEAVGLLPNEACAFLQLAAFTSVAAGPTGLPGSGMLQAALRVPSWTESSTCSRVVSFCPAQ